MKRGIWVLSIVMCLPAAAWAAPGDVLFSSDMDSGTGWTLLSDADTVGQFGWDYTADATLGIPASPSGSTTGLHMQANVSSGTANVFAAVADTSITVPHRVEFNFWTNANGPFPGGGGGSTEFIGGGVGHDASTIGLNGGSLIITGEGGSSRDWRMYKDTGEQFIASTQYAISDNNAAGPELSAAFPGQMPTAAQQANYAQQTGTVQDGTPAFGWHTMLIESEPALGQATFFVDGLEIGTLDTNIGSPVAVAGSPAVYYADLFSSVSDNATLSFGIIDDYQVIEIPEPTTLSLLVLGGLALLRRR